MEPPRLELWSALRRSAPRLQPDGLRLTGVFHVEHDFSRVWSDFNKVLKQRNAYLRNWQGQKGSESWDILFCDFAENLSAKREKYLAELSPLVNEVFRLLSKDRNLELIYLNGWSNKKKLADVLKSNTDKDLHMGYTHSGPHRYDVNIVIDGKACRQYSSRGEQKLIGYAIRIGQAILLGRVKPKACIIMCDDLQSEFDSRVSSRLFEFFETMPHQVIVTSLNEIAKTSKPSADEVFHMEHGKFK